MNNSVENRFFAIVCGALLIFVAPLFVLFLFLSSERADKEIRDHISVLLVANSQALAKPLWDLDEDSVDADQRDDRFAGRPSSRSRSAISPASSTSTQSTIPKILRRRTRSGFAAQSSTTPSMARRTSAASRSIIPKLGLFSGLKQEESRLHIDLHLRRADRLRHGADRQPHLRHPAADAADGSHRGDPSAWLAPSRRLAVERRDGPPRPQLQRDADASWRARRRN